MVQLDRVGYTGLGRLGARHATVQPGCAGYARLGRVGDGPDGSGGAQEGAALLAGGLAQGWRGGTGVEGVVQVGEVGPGACGGGEGGGDQARRGQAAAEERVQVGKVADAAGGHRGFQAAGVGVPAGREAPVGEQEQHGVHRCRQNRK